MAASLSGLYFRPGRYPTLVFLVLFPFLVSLGLWQLDRAHEKEAMLKARAERQQGLPLDLGLVRSLADDDRFRPARAYGYFLPRQQWLQDNQVHAGQPGYHVYSLFELSGSGGRAVLVNRGWVPLGLDRARLPEVPLPTGDLALQGRLDRPASVGIALGEVDYQLRGLSVLPYLDVAKLGEAIGRDLLPMALVLDEGQPGALTADPIPVAAMGPEKHLGYAVQWFGLATALLMIYVGLNTRREK
jgi:surfeit locus 1 family protein